MQEPYEKGVAIRSAPSFALDVAKCPAKRKQGERPTRLRILRGERPRAVNSHWQSASVREDGVHVAAFNSSTKRPVLRAEMINCTPRAS